MNALPGSDERYQKSHPQEQLKVLQEDKFVLRLSSVQPNHCSNQIQILCRVFI